jgi:hypothetical protein
MQEKIQLLSELLLLKFQDYPHEKTSVTAEERKEHETASPTTGQVRNGV